MALFLLLDVGSTFTKAVVVDTDTESVVAQGQAPTTAADDVCRGVDAACAALTPQGGLMRGDFDQRLACSSAAGGLAMVAVGLAPEFTAEAARQAALGAGAKVTEVFAGKLTEADVARLRARRPDVLLLCGGTDGGDEDTVRHNVAVLSRALPAPAVIYAGNQALVKEVEPCLRAAGPDVTVVPNVLPELYQLNVEPTRAAIREVFLRRIIHAKGLDAVADFVDAPILPTPFAVLRAAELLAEGAAGEPGWGNLLVVDVGGATTDVHSVAEEPLLPPGWIRRGLPEPRVKRTVEGDLGLRLNAETLLQAARQLGNWEIRQLGNWETGERGNWETGERGNGATLPDGPIPEFPDCLISEFPGFLQRYAAHVSHQVDHVASTEAEAFCEDLLARAAVALAVARHAGTVEELSTPTGRVFRQQGKDLSAVTAVLGTGGIFAHTHAPRWLLAPAVQEPPGARPASLRPTASRFWRDRAYCLWAGGLLREAAPGVALRLMRSSLEEV